MNAQYMLVKTEVVGTPADYSFSHWSDLVLSDDRQGALDHGWELFDHDDFNIATVEDYRITALGWGHEDFEPEDSDIPEIERQLCLPDVLRRRAEAGGVR